jgi:endonuclease/exonuclease/phosphatase family metal-dependent hydrolase
MHLVTWNTQWCCGLDGRSDPARIVQAVQALGHCDVLCLQEIAVNYPQLAGQPGDQVAQLQALLPDWQIFFGAAVDEWTPAGRQRFGNLIATRLPVLQVQHYPLPYPADAGVRSMSRICTQVTVQDPQLGAVRVLTTHLEYYSKRQRMSQVRYLRRLHLEALSQLCWAPQPAQDGSPFQTKAHTPHAVLCGDFNFEAHEPEYEAMGSQAGVIECLDAGWPEQVVGARWHDAWRVLSPQTPQPPTFKLFDRTYGPDPVACDFVWLSDSLRAQVRSLDVEGQTQASDHQPVRVVLGA